MGCLPGQEGGGAKGTRVEARDGGKGAQGQEQREKKNPSHVLKLEMTFKCKRPGVGGMVSEQGRPGQPATGGNFPGGRCGQRGGAGGGGGSRGPRGAVTLKALSYP